MNEVRAPLKRFQSASSAERLRRGSAFHSSRSAVSRSEPLRYSVPAAIFSASVTISVLRCSATACSASRAAFLASRAFSIWGASAVSRASSEARSPRAAASEMFSRALSSALTASAGESAPDSSRFSSNSTSVSRAPKRRS